MTQDDPEALNVRAYLALAGAALDWRSDLARLLRSDVALDRLLRDRLADAIENQSEHGPRLELKNHKKARDRFVSVATKHEWMQIGRATQTLLDLGMPAGEAVQMIAARANASDKKVEEALHYFRIAARWVERGLASEAGDVLGREMLERLYHSIEGSAASRRLNEELLGHLGLSQ